MNQPPTWAGRSVPAGEVAGTPEPKKDKRGPLLPILGVGALLLVGGAGFALGNGSSDDQADSATSTTIEQGEPTTSSAPATTDADTTAAPTTDAEAAAAEQAEAGGVEEAAAEAPPATAEERRAVLKGGKLYLRGEIPAQEVADVIVQRAAAVIGPDNVVNEYVINPAAPLPESAPLYVEDLVLFAYGSEEINPAFSPLLDLGILLMSQNPTVVVTVVSHTDAAGSEAFNMALSERRGETVRQYWLERGANDDQIVIDARGESNPIGDNDTTEGAQLNRRAEFVITGLLG